MEIGPAISGQGLKNLKACAALLGGTPDKAYALLSSREGAEIAVIKEKAQEVFTLWQHVKKNKGKLTNYSETIDGKASSVGPCKNSNARNGPRTGRSYLTWGCPSKSGTARVVPDLEGQPQVAVAQPAPGGVVGNLS